MLEGDPYWAWCPLHKDNVFVSIWNLTSENLKALSHGCVKTLLSRTCLTLNAVARQVAGELHSVTGVVTTFVVAVAQSYFLQCIAATSDAIAQCIALSATFFAISRHIFQVVYLIARYAAEKKTQSNRALNDTTCSAVILKMRCLSILIG